MKRRQFINLGALLGLSTVLSTSLNAVDFRQTKPSAWTAHTVDDAIKNMYGDISPISSGITLGTPNLATNGGKIPLSVKSDLGAKSMAIFQDANPESAVIVYTLHKHSIIDYTLQIKMKDSGTVTVVLEGIDGKFYIAKKTFTVTSTGCDG